MATIAFLGLGQMGSPMANNLLQKGHSLQVFDVNTQAVDALVTQGATAAQTPAEAAASAEFIHHYASQLGTLFDRCCWG